MKKALLIVLTLIFCVALLVGCSAKEPTYDGCHKVIFELEGGLYRNSDKAVEYFYDIPEGKSCKIRSIEDFDSNKTLSKIGYVLDGWYRTRTEQEVDGETVVTYSDKWDFDNDTISGSDTTTLYACWKSPIVHSYELYVFHDKDVLLGTYEAVFGAAFNDMFNYATNSENAPFGYTFLEYVDENGEDWATHGRTHTDETKGEVIKVYAKYIKGDYQLITKASDFATLDSAKNVYLTCDIDFSQAEERYRSISFGNFVNRVFEGNGHTLSNFSISYTVGSLISDSEEGGQSLHVSLFGNGKGSTIKNVNFENVTVDIDWGNSKTDRIYVAPLFTTATNCVVENVHVDLTVSVTLLPDKVADITLFDGVFGKTTETNTVDATSSCSVTRR